MNGRYLSRRQDGDEVFVDLAHLLLHNATVGLLLELLAVQPEEEVLLTELRPQELTEAGAARRTLHQSLKGLRPGAGVLQCRLGAMAGKGTRGSIGCFTFCKVPADE